MTTMQLQSSNSGLGVLAITALIVLAIVAMFVSRAGEVEQSDGIAVEYGAHAESHGVEANLARRCFGENGTVAKFKQEGRFARLCQFGDGWVALQILVEAGGVMQEVSSYIPHLTDSTLQGVKDWMLRCGWVAYNGVIP